MNKKYIYLLLSLLLFGCSKEEVSDLQADYYIKFYGEFLEDNGYSALSTLDGGLIITGSIERMSTGKDIVLIKTDEFGNQAEWSPKFFGYGSNDEAYCIENLQDGYLIAGSTTNNEGDKDAILIQTDLQGNQVGKEFIYGGSRDQYALSIEKRSAGGYMVVGYSINPADMSKSFFVITLDEGLENPRITTSSSRGEEFVRVIRNNENEYLALGTQYLGSESQFFVAKLNTTGNIFDLAFFGSPNLQEVLRDVVSTNDSTLYLYGTVTESGSSTRKLILKKIVNLEESWTRIISGSGNLDGKAITADENGNLVVAADKTFAGDKNILVYFLDEDGNVTESKEYGQSGDQTVEDILLTPDNVVIIGGNAYGKNRMISVIKADRKGNIWQ